MSNNLLIFRTDGNATIGMGHIYRCLSIAKKAKQYGLKSYFVIADSGLQNMINSVGMQCIILDTDYRNMESEIDKLGRIIYELRPLITIIDSYFISRKYMEYIKKLTTLFWITDNDEDIYPTDYLLNYNLFATKIPYEKLYKKKGYDVPNLLIGLSFVPLRKEFEDVQCKQYIKTKNNIFISSGGADPEHCLFKLIDEILSGRYEEYTFHVVVGLLNPDKDMIIEYTKYISNIKIYYNIGNIKEIMETCHVAICSGGFMIYELCACKVPTVLYILADNQIIGVNAFIKEGLALYGRDCRDNESFPKEVITEAIKLNSNKTLHKNIKQKLFAINAEAGTKNIIKKIRRRIN